MASASWCFTTRAAVTWCCLLCVIVGSHCAAIITIPSDAEVGYVVTRLPFDGQTATILDVSQRRFFAVTPLGTIVVTASLAKLSGHLVRLALDNRLRRVHWRSTVSVAIKQAADRSTDAYRPPVVVAGTNRRIRRAVLEPVAAAVSETASPRTYVVSVPAPGTDASYRFYISDAADAGPFVVDSYNGSVILNATVSYDDGPTQYYFTVNIENDVLGTLDQAGVNVTVLPVNNKPPFFTMRPPSQPYLASVSYFAPAGTSVLQLSASDADVDSSLVFGIASGNDAGIFTMSRAGLIATNRRRLLPDGAQYLLTVYVQDENTVSGAPSATAQVLVTVGVLLPQFDADVYFPIVPEKAAVGYTAQAISVKSFQGSPVRFTMGAVVPPPPQPLFRLYTTGGNTATLVTLRTVNLLYGYDALQYQLTVTAVEVNTYLSSTVQVNVTILPGNGNSPDFGATMIVLPKPFDADVPVGTAITTVYAYDPDLGDNGRLTYSLSWIPDLPLPFAISTVPAASGPGYRYAGVLTVSGPLDYNAVRSTGGYNLQITATDHGNVSRSGVANITVVLSEVDMSAPVFQSGVQVLIERGKAVGSLVSDALAFDADGSTLLYQFYQGGLKTSLWPPFAIDSSTGVITLSSSLGVPPYSTVDFFNLTVSATSSSSCCYPRIRPQRTGLGTVIVLVVGTNHLPVISNCSSLAAAVKEKTAGLHVIQVPGVDRDKGPNGELSYYIVQESGDYFTINPVTGMVTTKSQVIDRDTGPTNQQFLTVEARDNGTQPLSAFCTITIQIIDINDNKPIMNLPPSINVGSSAGNSSVLYYLYSEDRDMGVNAQVTYSISKNSPDMRFYIASSNQLKSYYDMVVGNSYTIEVTARDLGSPPQSSAQQMVIRVVAVPRAPAFVYPPAGMAFNVDETAPADYLVMSARAAMAGDNVSYTLMPSANEIFYGLGSNQSCVATNSFCLAVYTPGSMDAGKKTSYTARIRAIPQTGGSSNDISETFVPINVRDVNDKVPIFWNLDSNNNFAVSYPENSLLTPAIQLAKLFAHDDDPTPLFQTATYLMYGGADAAEFSVTTSGSLSVAYSVTFDREVQASYSVIAAAQDGALSARPGSLGSGLPNTGTVPVRVVVIDVNDNPPSFAQSLYPGEVLETRSLGWVVMTVTAEDADISNNWQYALTSGNTNGSFAVDNSGVITVHEYLDYDARILSKNPPYYYMQLTVSDGIWTAQTFINISLIPANMHAPVFRQPVYFGRAVDKFPYSDTNINLLTTVVADDADLNQPTAIYYDLQGSLASSFIIDHNSGQIWLRAPLARDGPGGRLTWNISVTATDEPSPYTKIGYTVLCVVLDDINDQRPVFSPASLVGSVPELASNGQNVMVVSATDGDAGPNGTVTYQLLPGSITGYATLTGLATTFPVQTKPIFLMAANGQITTNTANLNRDVVDYYTLLVVASDQGSPPLSSSATATIMITDGNNHSPQFSQTCWVRTIPEGTAVGANILTVSATDGDPSDTILYRIVGSTNTNFAVNSSSGAVSLIAPLIYNYAGFNTYSIWLTAWDGLYTDTACFNFTVIASTTVAVFDRSNLTVSIPENVTIGFNVVQLHAAERNINSARNTQLQYLIDRVSDPDRYFSVDPSSGWISTARLLDRESQPSYELSILAVVSGLPPGPATATLLVRVTVADVPDEAPMLNVSTVYITEMLANAPSDPPILYMYDPDGDSSPPFTMAAYGASASSNDFTFSFDPSLDPDPATGLPRGAGRIMSARALRREVDGPQQTFQLKLADAAGRSAVRNLTIIIADIDNNPPQAATSNILAYNYMGWISNGTYRLTPLGICYAADPDDWDLRYKTFGMVNNWPSAFSIDQSTGVISADLSALVPDSTVTLQCTVTDRYITDLTCKDTCRTTVTVTSTVVINVKTVPGYSVADSGSVRFKGVTAEQFMKAGSYLGSQPSKYNLFKQQLAQLLGTDVSNVDVFTVRDVVMPSPSADSYVDIRYTAHGSPYYNETKLIAAVIKNQAAIERQLGVTVAQSPVNECAREGCSGGCTNELVIGTLPLRITANGSSLVSIDSHYQAVCGGCALADDWQPQSCDGPDACLNGGACSVNDASLAVSCVCPAGFDGPRCQQTSHSFSGNGWAWYPTLAQCNVSITSLEISTSDGNVLIFYNGPFEDPGSGPFAVPDFIALTLESGQPNLYVDQGTGAASASVPVNIADGKWHKIEIIRSLRDIRLVVDSCLTATPSASDPTTYNRSGCESSLTTPLENMYINVFNPLEMGGRSDGATAYWPPILASNSKARRGFNGCVRNFVHLGKLYDLYTGSTGTQQNSNNGCAQLSAGCGASAGGAAAPCGPNSTCIAVAGGTWTCSCLPQWYGSTCGIPTPLLEFDVLGYIDWTLGSSPLYTLNKNQYYFRLQMTFRSRDPDGSGWLLSTTDETGALYMRLELAGGLLQLRYSLGDNVVGSVPTAVLRIGAVVVTDGQLHTALVVRIGNRIQLWLDDDAYYADNGQPYYAPQLYAVGANASSGAWAAAMTSSSNGSSVVAVSLAVERSMLDQTCITDVRISDMWLPTTMSANPSGQAATVVDRSNVGDNCTSTACLNDPCNVTFVCVDLWREALCTCPAGYTVEQQTCSAPAQCSALVPCQNGGTCVTKGSVSSCVCTVDSNGVLWQGTFCNVQAPQAIVALSSDAVAAIVAVPCGLILVLVIALIVLSLRRQRRLQKGDSDYDPYEDIRETIVHYDEEGVPEEDQDAFDISRLGKHPLGDGLEPWAPDYSGPQQEPEQLHLAGSGETTPPFLDMGEPPHPDVGDFISHRLDDADNDDAQAPSTDALHDYAYEGDGSVAGTLSSLDSSAAGSDRSSDASQDYDYLNDWGPRFQRLADMYSGGTGSY